MENGETVCFEFPAQGGGGSGGGVWGGFGGAGGGGGGSNKNEIPKHLQDTALEQKAIDGSKLDNNLEKLKNDRMKIDIQRQMNSIPMK